MAKTDPGQSKNLMTKAPPPEDPDEQVRDYVLSLEARIRELDHKVACLQEALKPFARLPDAFDKPSEATLYTLVRDSGQAIITCGDIRNARQVMEMK